jgi:hypothetical protein
MAQVKRRRDEEDCKNLRTGKSGKTTPFSKDQSEFIKSAYGI